MKKKYPGLSTRKIVVEGQPLMEASIQKIKAKTQVKDWGVEEQFLESGVDNELHSMDISTTMPVETGTP